MTLTVSDVAAEAAVSTDVKVQIMGSALQHALKRVTPAADMKDKYLPVFMCVKIVAGPRYEVEGKGKRDLTFLTTDRYVMVRQTVTVDDEGDTFPGEASIVIDLTRLPKLNTRTCYELTFGEEALVLRDLYDSITMTIPVQTYGEFPKLEHLFAKPLDVFEAALPPMFQLSSKVMAQLAKIAYQRAEAVRFHYQDAARPDKPFVISIPGDENFAGMVMPQRITR